MEYLKIVLYLASFGLASSNKSSQYTQILPAKRLDVEPYQNLTVSTITECVLTCMNDNKCQSANLEKTNGSFSCHFLRESLKESGMQLMTEADSHSHIHFESQRGVVKDDKMCASCRGENTNSSVSCKCMVEKPAKRSCNEHFQGGLQQDGIYLIKPDQHVAAFPVFCDMDLESGGWEVFQRRMNGNLDFTKFSRGAYKNGIGNLDGEFWLGLKYIHILTATKPKRLLIELMKFDGLAATSLYDGFQISNGKSGFKLTIGKWLQGTTRDSLLTIHNNKPFTYPEESEDSCVKQHKGGWWYGSAPICLLSNLNGYYYKDGHSPHNQGLIWATFGSHHNSMRMTEMQCQDD